MLNVRNNHPLDNPMAHHYKRPRKDRRGTLHASTSLPPAAGVNSHVTRPKYTQTIADDGSGTDVLPGLGQLLHQAGLFLR